MTEPAKAILQQPGWFLLLVITKKDSGTPGKGQSCRETTARPLLRFPVQNADGGSFHFARTERLPAPAAGSVLRFRFDSEPSNRSSGSFSRSENWSWSGRRDAPLSHVALLLANPRFATPFLHGEPVAVPRPLPLFDSRTAKNMQPPMKDGCMFLSGRTGMSLGPPRSREPSGSRISATGNLPFPRPLSHSRRPATKNRSS